MIYIKEFRLACEEKWIAYYYMKEAVLYGLDRHTFVTRSFEYTAKKHELNRLKQVIRSMQYERLQKKKHEICDNCASGELVLNTAIVYCAMHDHEFYCDFYCRDWQGKE